MALWWLPVRKTQGGSKDEQKGLTPYMRLIKEIHVIASATWCYHV